MSLGARLAERLAAGLKRVPDDETIRQAFFAALEHPLAVSDASRLPYSVDQIRNALRSALERERSPKWADALRGALERLDLFFEIEEEDRVLVDLVNERVSGVDLASSPEGEIATLLDMKYNMLSSGGLTDELRAMCGERISAVLRGEGFIKTGDYRAFGRELKVREERALRQR